MYLSLSGEERSQANQALWLSSIIHDAEIAEILYQSSRAHRNAH